MNSKNWIPYSEFEEYAPDNVGEQVRVNHSSSDCSGGRESMVVSRTKNGDIQAHCFRCGKSGYKADGTINPYKHRPVNNVISNSLELPTDLEPISADLPVDVIMYLHKFGLYEYYCVPTSYSPKYWKLYYSPLANRVYYGINKDTWLARSMGSNASNKWIEKLPDKYAHCLFTSPVISKFNTHKVLFIVEDLVSALTLQREGYNAVCLFGSEFTSRHRYIIQGLCETTDIELVGVWLDNDNPKIKLAQGKIKSDLDAYCDEKVVIIKSDYDPKEYCTPVSNIHQVDFVNISKGTVSPVLGVEIGRPSSTAPPSLTTTLVSVSPK